MKTLLSVLIIFVCLPAFSQRFTEELPNIAALKTRLVGSINKAVFVRDFAVLGDGGGGLFVITNSSILVDEIFRVASTQNPAWSYDRRFTGPVDLRWGGAVGDGSAGDNVKIAAVKAAAVAKGYGVVAGNFPNSKPLLTLNRSATDYVLLDPTATNGTTPFRLGSFYNYSLGNLFEIGNSNITRFAIEDDGTLQISTATNRLGVSGSDLVYENSGAAAFTIGNGSSTIRSALTASGLNASIRGGITSMSLEMEAGGGLYTSSTFVAPLSPVLDLGGLSTTWRHLNLSGHINWNGTTNTVWDLAGNGSPEGVVAASPGSTYRSFDGGSATTLYVKESGAGNTGWVPMSAFLYNYGQQFDVGFNTNINLAVGLSTTNQAMYGNVTAPAVNLGSVSGAFGIDAAAALEFTALLAGDSTITLTNFNDYHPVSIMFTNGGNFSITWVGVDNMYWMPNGTSSQVTNDWGAGIINRFTFWKTGGRIIASDKEGLSQLGGGGGASGGNPTASVGLAAINGVSSLFMRSDAAPPISQSITPTWTGLHTFLGAGANLIDLKSTTAASSGSNLRVPFRFLDTDLAYYEAAAINVTRIPPWDGTAPNRDGIMTLDVLLNGAAGATTMLQLYSAGGNPLAWFKPAGIDVVVGSTAALATTATSGFLYITTCAGTPTGVPANASIGAVSLVFDTTNNKLYAYDGGWIDVTGSGSITTPVSIANGGTGTNTMGTAIGNVPFLSASSTNRLTVDNGNFNYDESSRVLKVLHPTTTAQPHFWALNVDTGVSLQTWANRLFVSGASDFTLETFDTATSILFTNNGVRVLELTPEWSTVVGDGTTTTSRTNKMFYIPTFAGLPTGVPHVETGRVPIGYNTTASKLYAYNSGWKDVAGPGFVRLPVSQATLPVVAPARLDYVSTTGLKRLLFATNETCYFQFTLPQDYGSSPVLRIPYSCSGAITNSASFSVSVWAQTPGDALAADTESYDTANTGTDTVPGTLNFPDVVTVTLTTNDSMAAGDTVALRISSTTLAALNDLRVRGDMVLEYAKQ